jgi:hypothetical protein
MPSNELNHNRRLSNLNTEAKYAKHSRRWSRYGRNGETHKCTAWQEARKAYNKAHRRASKLQLSRYQTPEQSMHIVTYTNHNNADRTIKFVTLSEVVKFVKVLAAQRITYTHIFEE